ncbi:homoserine O-acetyltransferase [Methanobrevibacter arboriphilus]|jgi:homoserine O-acetyltransferase|uniref:Homoserine O-acetyltransferase n=1 Tax=Methanobrevibacter arboriphilus TaxID=39441 RepID=A0ACA8R252_METAZ|nr:alpha/beta fold hydrolase [Methanobrevibacter arboriphilus]BBL61352.1 homoserine O-acetyltransferase [Methanobrevibacter arboriphilus]GLI11314.1 homoserine O-acetyltransferase [Methanobrevibacter arboriphilus]
MAEINENLLKFEKSLDVKYSTLKSFEFSSGEILDNLTVEYLTIGNKIINDNDEIINAIVYFHGLGENCLSIKHIHEVIGEGKVLDTNKYFIISITALGSPNSFSPSISGLGSKFPRYNINDMINFQKEFLNSEFNVKHVKGLIGNSMGGSEALMWGTLYPSYMDFIISLVNSYKISGNNYILFSLINQIVKSDSNYNNGDYKEPLKSVGIANQLFYPFGFSAEYYRNNDINMINKELNSLKDNFKGYDGNDIILRGDATSNYNIEKDLSKIIAKTLIVAINQDQLFPPTLDAIPMSKMIKNSKLVIYDSIFGHLGVNEIIKIENELKDFLNKF